MIRTLLLGTAIATFSVSAIAQTTLLNEGFESFMSGDSICQVSPSSITWTQPYTAIEDTPVSDEQAHTGSNSMKVIGDDGPTDVLLLLGDENSGEYTLSMWVYVGAGHGGYFNVQHIENPPGTEYALEVFLSAAETGVVRANNVNTTFSYTSDTWFNIAFEIDVPGDLATALVDNTPVVSWPWATLFLGGAGSNTIGAVDFYAQGQGSSDALFYIDDITFVQNSVGVNEIANGSHISVFPVPTSNVLNITNERIERLTMQVFDITGQQVLPMSVMRANSARHQLDVSALNSGVYFLELDNGKQKVVKRFTRE